MKFHKSSKFIIDFDWDLKNKKIYEHEKLHHTDTDAMIYC